MKTGRLSPTLIAAALLLAACAPQNPAPPPAAASPSANQPQAAATSRGDQLQATDPATVSLASGGLQLVEFFRFT